MIKSSNWTPSKTKSYPICGGGLVGVGVCGGGWLVENIEKTSKLICGSHSSSSLQLIYRFCLTIAIHYRGYYNIKINTVMDNIIVIIIIIKIFKNLKIVKKNQKKSKQSKFSNFQQNSSFSQLFICVFNLCIETIFVWC